MGSNWGSHTLVTYPLLRSMGLSRNRAVSTVVGATAVTDTSALLVLSVVSGTVQPTGTPWACSWSGSRSASPCWWPGRWCGLPVVARWFFARVGTDRSYRFVFGIATFLVGGVLAEAAGIDAIVGAFFAGLGLNRAIPEESSLMDRLQFMGSTLFIPIFLVSVGVLLEPRVMIDPKTLGIALVFTLAVLGGKALAAVIAGRAFRFTWPEVGVMSGLSGSQAAATLATTLVGAKLGLFDTETINAVLVVILASLVVTPAMVSFFGKRVSSVAEEARRWGRSCWSRSGANRRARRSPSRDGSRPATAGSSLAASFAEQDGAAARGCDAAQAHEARQRNGWRKEGRECRTLFRVAPSVPEGLLETVIEEDATLLVSRVADVAPQRGEERGLRGSGPRARAGPDRARRRRALRSAGARRSGDQPARADERGPALATQIAAHFGHHTRIAAVAPAGGEAQARARFGPKQTIDWIASDDPVGWARAESAERRSAPLRRDRHRSGGVAQGARARPGTLPGGAGGGDPEGAGAPRTGRRTPPCSRGASLEAPHRLTY